MPASNPNQLLSIMAASGPTEATAKPDNDRHEDNDGKIVLESVSGRKHEYNLNTPFYGDCRDVDDFKKLNRVGEGTYGVV
jgi:hypothetical protein